MDEQYEVLYMYLAFLCDTLVCVLCLDIHTFMAYAYASC